MGGIERSLQGITGDGRVWFTLGQVTKVETSTTWGLLLTVLVPSLNVELQARPAWLIGGATGEGMWVPVAVDDEVLLFMPDGDPNRAVALAGVTSKLNLPPSGWNNDRVSVVQVNGMEVRTSPAAVVEAVVLESLLTDMQAALTEVQAALAALGLPTTNLAALIANLPTLYRAAALRSE